MAAEKRIAIEASYVLLPENGQQTVVRDKTVVIEGDHIDQITDQYTGPADVRIHAEGRLLSPGFINGHTHVGCATYSRGLAEDQDLIANTAFYHYFVPLLTVGNKNFTPDEFAAILEWDILEMVRKGSTTILEESFGGYETVVEIVKRLGNRAYVSPSYPSEVTNIGYIKDGKLQYDRPSVDVVSKGLKRNIEFFKKHNGSADDRIRVRLSPTGPDTCPPEVLRATREAADRLGCGISTHASHHHSEFEYCRKNFDSSPIEHLANTGILGPDAVITHVTFTEENDRKLLAKSKSTIVHCPYRKAKEAVTSPYFEYLERGINSMLGTDSFSSDITENIKMAAVLGKIRLQRVGAPSALDAVNSATLAGARGLNRDDLGQIKPGAKADLLIIDLTKPHNFPVIDPVKNFVYYSYGSDIETVIVNGKILVDKGKALTTDEEDLRRRVKAAAERIWGIADKQGVMPKSTVVEATSRG